MRTDEHNNPMAFTTTIADQAGLIHGVDYQVGEPFRVAQATFFTAKLIGDPVALTIRVIDAIGFYTKGGLQRWTYMAIPKFVWDSLTEDQKRDVIGFGYQHEGGTAMRRLFPRYGQA